jgi:hypothetical protein
MISSSTLCRTIDFASSISTRSQAPHVEVGSSSETCSPFGGREFAFGLKMGDSVLPHPALKSNNKEQTSNHEASHRGDASCHESFATIIDQLFGQYAHGPPCWPQSRQISLRNDEKVQWNYALPGIEGCEQRRNPAFSAQLAIFNSGFELLTRAYRTSGIHV